MRGLAENRVRRTTEVPGNLRSTELLYPPSMPSPVLAQGDAPAMARPTKGPIARRPQRGHRHGGGAAATNFPASAPTPSGGRVLVVWAVAGEDPHRLRMLADCSSRVQPKPGLVRSRRPPVDRLPDLAVVIDGGKARRGPPRGDCPASFAGFELAYALVELHHDPLEARASERPGTAGSALAARRGFGCAFTAVCRGGVARDGLTTTLAWHVDHLGESNLAHQSVSGLESTGGLSALRLADGRH